MILEFKNKAFYELMQLHCDIIMDIIVWQYDNDWPLKREDPIRFKALIEVANKKAISKQMQTFLEEISHD